MAESHDTNGQPSNTPSSPPVPSSRRPETSSRRQITLGRVVTIVLVVATIAVLLRALLTPSAPSAHGASISATPGSAAPLANHYAPDATLLDLHNNRVALSSWRGKVVVLNFWYVACAPCQYEMPALQQVYDAQYSKGLIVVGVNTSDDAVSITQFVKALGITYPILRDIGQRTTIEYRVVDTPTSFFIDRHGVIRYKVIGPLDKATLNQETATLLAQG
jgi:cytochrome c biogenesis protein CcmG, thiol:disulfide interchange protein DsbE